MLVGGRGRCCTLLLYGACIMRIDADLWPAVQAVAEAMRQSTAVLTNKDIVVLATTAQAARR